MMRHQQTGLETGGTAGARLVLVPLALAAVFAVSGCDRADDGYTTPDVETERDERTPPAGTPANPGGSTP